MSSVNDMPPPATKGRTPKKQQPKDTAPDPNADRAPNYPNRWRIERGKQTAKCMFCSHSLAGTKWCVVCENCNKRMCSPCWEGDRFNKYGEALFEGKAQNDEGCWCRFPTKFDPAWQAANDARAARMEKLLAAEMQTRRVEPPMANSDGDNDIQQPVAKRLKLESAEPEAHASSVEYEDSAVRFDGTFNEHKKSPAVDSVQQLTPEVFPEQHMRIKHLHNKTTVIIGAGVIGLAIARELAAVTRQTHTNHEIIVVEKHKNYAQGTSQHCVGIVARHGVPRGYEHLLDLSLGSWRALLGVEAYRKEFQHHADGVIHVERPSGREEDVIVASTPAWYDARPQDVLNTYNSDVGKIATSKFVKILYQECKSMEVKFRFRQEVTNIEKTRNAKLTSVDIAKVGNPARYVEVPCHNLIVAAGSHTLDALHEIVPWVEPRTSLVNKKQHCDWIRVQGLASFGNADKVGLLIHNLPGSDPIIMAGQSHQELVVSSVRPRNQHVPFDDSTTEKAHFTDAALVARDRLNGINETTTITDGHTTISTALDGLPLVCKIPSIILDDRFEGEENHPLGIYLAYGFGMYGTTMSLGVAAAVRAMMMGDDSGIEEAFDYP